MEKIFHTLRRTMMTTYRPVDYSKLIDNIEEMINTLEYDSSRSGGKTKLNCDKLYFLYFLLEKYKTKINNHSKITPKTTKPKQEVK